MKYIRVHVSTAIGTYEVSGVDVDRVISEAGMLASVMSMKMPGAQATIRVIDLIDFPVSR